MRISKALRCFLTIILIGGIGLMSIPSMAYTVDGVELVEVTLTYQDYINMFAEGGFTVSCKLSSPTSVDITLFDMYQNATSTVVTVDSNGVTYPITEIYNNTSNILFASRYAYNLRVNANSELLSEYIIDLPFDFYLNNASFYPSFRCSGTSSTSATTNLNLKSNGVTEYNNSSTDSINISYWSDISATRTWVNRNNISTFPSGYTFDTSSTGIRTKSYSHNFTGISTSNSIDQIIILSSVSSNHTSGTGYNYSFIAPIQFTCIFPRTVYVMPDISDTVVEYLDLIAGPITPEQQDRIDELKDKFSDTLDDLDGAKENIHKDMPDLPSVSDLPDEAIDGMEDASEYVINPFLSIGIVSTLLGVTFIFTVIKILLYGSGPY